MAINCTPVALRHLQADMITAEISVRVVHLWERKSFYNKEETLALEMLLLDAEDNLIQVTIRKRIIFKFKDRISEGHLYKLSRFTVEANKGAEMATSEELRIYFAYPTVVREVHNLSIPRYGFRFVDFGDILSERVSDEHFIDVIGKFSGVGEVKPTKNGNSWMTIYIENIRKEKLACSIWNDYVGLVQAFADACKSSTEPAIIVIRCVQRCKWEGEPRVITTRHATRFYFNHAIPEVEAFLGELYAGQEPSNSNVISYISSESEDMLSGDNLSTITEIKKCQKAGRYVTLATIYDVDLSVKWYYDSCKHCTSKVVKNDSGRWVCKKEKCIGSTEGSEISIPRYQVKFRVIGADNEVSEFVIFETQITSFINVSAADMLAALEENGRKDDMPDFDIFIDKQFIFKVEIHPKYNLEQK
ncbi:replication protein A 70 kDa DNA-binding subunit C-like [Silene latifolia]|uniref:replication protein A 70 kDa DNA-binding subunit C-like n=1 Tax=Silene latifolia TaxID=37657 RepID=UPI003D770B5D